MQQRTDAELNAELTEWRETLSRSRKQGRAIAFGDRSKQNWTPAEINAEIDAIETELLNRKLRRQGSSYLGLSGRFIGIN